MERAVLRKNAPAAAILALGLVVIALAYLPVRHAGWNFDDVGHVNNNDAVKINELTPAALWRAATRSPLDNRPLSYVTFALDYRRAGLSPGPFHVTNLVIHLVAVLAAFLVLERVFALLGPAAGLKDGRAAAAVGAVLYGANPVQAQSVAYIVQRMNLLASLFVMAAAAAWLWARSSEKGGRRRMLLAALAVLAALLGLWSKENAFSIFLIVPALDLCLSGDSPAGWLKSRARWIAPFGAAAVLIAVVFAARGHQLTGGELLSGYGERDFTLIERLLTQCRVVAWYAGLWLFPAAQRVSIDHHFVTSTGLLTPPATVLAVVALAAVTAAAIFRARKAPLLCLGWLWFAAGLALESSALPLEMVFEHRLYLPSLGLVMSAAALAGRLRIERRAAAPLLVVFALFAVGARQRANDWKDLESLWSDAARKAPEKARTWSNLCAGKYRAGKIDSARRCCEMAIALDPDDHTSWYNLGLSLYRTGRLGEAERAFARSIEIDPERHEVHYQYARSLARRGKIEEALAAFRAAASLAPEDPLVRYQFGVTLAAAGRMAEAWRELSRARALAAGRPGLSGEIDRALLMLKSQLDARGG